MTAVGFQPAAILTPAAAAISIAIVFALRPAAGVGAFLTVVLIVHTLEVWLNADLRYFDEISVALLVTLSAVRNWSFLVRLRPGWKEAALVVAVGAGIISSLVQAVPADTWVPALGLLVKGIASFYAISWLRLKLADVEAVCAVLLGVAGVILVLGVAEFLGPGPFQDALGLPPFAETRGGVVVVKSVFLHPALFGWFTAYASLFLYARFIVFRQWWTLAAALFFNVGTLLSGRRRPLLGVVSALAVGAAWLWGRASSPRAKMRVVLPIAAALVVLAALTWPALSGFYARTVDEYLHAGDIGEILSPSPNPDLIAGVHPRVALYVGSVAIARDVFPLGAGLGRFGSYMSEVDYSPLYERYGLSLVQGLGPENPIAVSDTYWPMVLAELGPIGVAGMAVFLGLLLVQLWRVASRTNSMGLRALALGGLFVGTEALVGSLTAATYVAAPIAYFVFAAAAAVAAVARSEPGATIPEVGDR